MYINLSSIVLSPEIPRDRTLDNKLIHVLSRDMICFGWGMGGGRLIYCPLPLPNLCKRQDKTIANRLVYIPNNDTQHYLFCRFKLVYTQLNKASKKITQVPKFVRPTNKKLLLTLGTSVINSPLSPISLVKEVNYIFNKSNVTMCCNLK